MTAYGARRRKLLSLARGDQVVALKPSNLFYLTDFWGGGAAVVQPDKTVIVTSPLESHRAGEVGKEAGVVVVKRWADVPKTVARLTGRSPTLVDEGSSFRKLKRFTEAPEAFLKARRVKDEVEVARITKASRGQDAIFEMLEREITPGRTEWEIASKVVEAATLNRLTGSGSDSALSPIIIASGENGAFPHSELSQRRVKTGDFVIADIFFRSEGYNSDETRTFAVGTPTAEMKRHYQAVLEAQLEAGGLAKVGRSCGDVDSAARRKLREHGVEKYLNHGIGHGVGIDIHELPSISKGSKVRLVQNDVVTVEPGVYLEGKYGVRIEDTIRVGASPEPLTLYTKELVEVG